MSISKWTPGEIRKLLNTPGAALELHKCIQKVYSELDFYDRENIKMVGRILDKNYKEIYGKKAGRFSMGELSFAELSIRLVILMMEYDWDAEKLKMYLKLKKDKKDWKDSDD